MIVQEPPDRALTDAERVQWLRLLRSDHVGPRTFRTLIRHYGSAGAALDALPGLARRGGASGAARVCSPAEAEREFDMASRMGVRLIGLSEAAYPARLRMIDDAPPLLSVRGHADALARPMVAVVGSRNASAAGLKFASQISRHLGDAGFVIASGLARGIDGAAHRASLATGTIAVIAGGQARLYPPEHIELAADIGNTGAVVSEMPHEWQARAQDFPRRNRIISGLSLGVVVIEAAARSGTLITARFAGEQGREVFAVPGSPLDPRAEGTNNLLKQGATLVTEADDVIQALRPIMGSSDGLLSAEEPDREQLDLSDPGAEQRARIVALLGPVPVAIDDLVRLSQCPPSLVRVVLLELELAGRLERHGGSRVSLI